MLSKELLFNLEGVFTDLQDALFQAADMAAERATGMIAAERPWDAGSDRASEVQVALRNTIIKVLQANLCNCPSNKEIRDTVRRGEAVPDAEIVEKWRLLDELLVKHGATREDLRAGVTILKCTV